MAIIKQISICLLLTFAWICLSLSGQVLAQQESSNHFQCIFYCQEPDTSAKAIFRLSQDGKKLEYTLKVQNIENITMSHLHLGKVGRFGSPVVWLYPSSPPPKLIPGKFSGILAEGTIEAEDLIGPLRNKPLSELIKHMERDHTYANIHTKQHPRGEIRGSVRLIRNESSSSADQD